MIVLIYIVAFISAILILLMVSPMKLLIDTKSNTYALQWKGIVQAALITIDQEPTIRMQTLVFKKDFNLLHATQKKKTEKKDKKSKSKMTKRMTFQRIKRMIKTFTIKSFYVNLDTDNFIMNGYLIPLFLLIKSPNKSMKINFVGQSNIQLIVENRLYKIIKAYIF